jgi:ABC-type polysaccharide/polyol phosphate export permease
VRAQLRDRARRTYDVLAELVRSDILIRYGRGRIRVLKWLLDPIAALGVYLLLVALVLDRGEEATGLSLLCAIVPFQLVVATVINAFQAVGLRSSIILNMSFPRGLIPVSAVVTETVVLTASLVLIPLMMAVYAVGPTPAVLWLVPAFAITIAFSLALAYPAALFGIWYPELMPFGVSLVRAVFFLATGLVALDEVTGDAENLLPFNPLTGLFESFRDALLYGQAPAAWELLVPLGAAALLLCVFYPLYRSEQSQLAKLIG